jgi:hypothetical protein
MTVIIEFLKELPKRIKEIANSNYLVLPESNYGRESQWLSIVLRNYFKETKRFYIMRAEKEIDGFRTDENEKFRMVKNIECVLKDKRLKFHRKLYTTFEGGDKKKFVNHIVEEMLNFSEIVKPSKTSTLPPRVFYGGKKGYGTDDTVIAIGIVLNRMNKYYTEKKYGGKFKLK